MKRTLLCILILAATLGLAVNAAAQSEAMSPLANLNTYQVNALYPEKESNLFTSDYLKFVNTQSDTYSDSPVEKMGVGVINTATSWTELPRKVSQVSEENNALVGWTLGLGEGVVSSVARGVSGAIDMATFGMPPYDKPLMDPEYKVKQPEEGFKIDLIQW